MKKQFLIIYRFKPNGETYDIIFFTDNDDIYKVKINSILLSKLYKPKDVDKLQAYLRRCYDYNKDSVEKIDNVELKGIYAYVKGINSRDDIYIVLKVIRNRKIDDVLSI